MRNNNCLVLTLLIILAATLMLIYLGKKSVWQDEALSVTLAQQDWETFWSVLSKRSNMGLYHLILHWWVKIGESEFIVRSLSVIFAIITVPMAYALGKRMFGSTVGMVAALLLTVNAFFIQYSQEARAYSLVLLLVTISSYFFVISVERPSWKYWIAYIFSSVLAVYSHLFSVLVLSAQAVSLVFLKRQDVPWRGFLISVVAIIFMTVPLAILIVNRGKYGLPWMSPPSLYSLLRVFYHLVGGNLLLLVAYFFLSLIALVIALKTLVTSGRSIETWRYFFVLTWLFGPIILAFSYSLYKPIFWPRFLIICLPPIVILASVGLTKIQGHGVWVSLASLSVMLVLSGHALVNWYSGYDKEGGGNWRQATRYVLSRAQTGDTIFFDPPFTSLPFYYYLNRSYPKGKIPNTIYNSSETYVNSRFQQGRWPNFDDKLLEQIPRKYDRVWLVGRRLPRQENGRSSTIQRLLQREYHLIESQKFETISLLLYEIKPP